MAQMLDRHGEQGNCFLLARGNQRVELSGLREVVTADRPSEGVQGVCLARHSGNADHHLVALLGAFDHAAGDVPDSVHVAHTGPAKFLDNQCHFDLHLLAGRRWPGQSAPTLACPTESGKGGGQFTNARAQPPRSVQTDESTIPRAGVPRLHAGRPAACSQQSAPLGQKPPGSGARPPGANHSSFGRALGICFDRHIDAIERQLF